VVLMDFDNPALMVSGMIISAIGFVLFVYGKKVVVPKCLLVGIGLMTLPFVVHSLVWIWVGAAAGLVGLKLAPGD
jgi:hypothetical protein